MRLVKVKMSRPKSKEINGKTYVWRQRYMNVPREYRDKSFLVVMSPEELVEILWNDEAREKAREEYNKLIKEAR